MSQAEFSQWVKFYEMFPFSDYHRYYRPSALVASINGGDMKKALEWLQPDPALAGLSEADVNTFKALGITPSVKDGNG
jgi:hypothetical protein